MNPSQELLWLLIAILLLDQPLGDHTTFPRDTLGMNKGPLLSMWMTSFRHTRLLELRGGGFFEFGAKDSDFDFDEEGKPVKWQSPRSGRYKDLPDDETAIQWRIADWHLDRRGAGSKARHARSREAGKHSLTQSMSFRKRPAESRRDRQGANTRSIDTLEREIMSFMEMVLDGTHSGRITEADCSDVFGRRWYKTEQGQRYLKDVQELQEFAAINRSTADEARYFGRTPEQLARDYANHVDDFRAEVFNHTGVMLSSASSTSEEDSIGDRFDWGWELKEDGSYERLGNWNFTDRGPNYVPQILRNYKVPESAWRRLDRIPTYEL